ncbi:hypothetical protein BC829DRAFT_449182 [Chytridium lagenaria]|nr:hypothetical protein BC829DRAFT_449182 [Chytridium lagenaria]
MSSSPAIDAVLEFTAVRAGSAVKSGPGIGIRSSMNGLDIPVGFVENPLLQGFTQLKARLTLIDDARDLDPMQVLNPFLDVIRSGDTTGPITDPSHPGMPAAMSSLTHSVTHCKFEATDAVSDEVVLSKILRLIRVVVTSEVGKRNLDDKGICEMVETGFGMCFQGRVSELLRRSAEQTLISLVHALFERLTVTMTLYKPSLPIFSGSGKTPIRALSRNHSLSTMQTLHSGDEPGPTITVSSGTTDNMTEEPNAVITVGMSDQSPRSSEMDGKDPTTPGVTTDESHHGIHIQLGGNEGIVVDTALRSKRSQSFSKTLENEETKDEKREKAPKIPPVAEESGKQSMEDPASSRFILPYGLPAILELLRVLVTLIDPRNRNHTDTMHRMVALGLLNVAIEVGGESLGEWVGWGKHVENVRKMRKASDGLDEETEEDKMAVAARDLVVNELTKYLFQLLQSSNITVISPPSTATLTLFGLTLRVVVSLFQTSRMHLKLQMEWLLEWIMARVNAGVVSWDVEEYSTNGVSQSAVSDREQMMRSSHRDSTSSLGSQAGVGLSAKAIVVPEVRELLLEAMFQLFKNSSFAAELWINYDGDMAIQGHLFEEVIRFLSKHSFPDATPGGPVTSVLHQTLCLDTLLLFLKNIISHSREPGTTPDFPLTEEDIRNTKHRKRILREGAERFNTKPSDGIAEWVFTGSCGSGIFGDFLKTTPRVSKKLLGEYLAKPANLELLKAFIQLYDFQRKRLDEALRLLLESFRLPGEAQQIDRILECFASVYFASTQTSPDPEIADQSSTFVLAFSIILLNTDQHNPQVRRRMTKEDFKRNTRGCNNHQDFDPEYLGKIYDAIKENEIVMPEEQKGIWAFDNAEDNLTLQKAIVGFHSCATVASRFNLPEVLDSIIVSLSKITGLLKDNGPLPEDTDVRPDESGGRTQQTPRKVDRWSVEFGRSYRGQVAAVLMFNLAVEYGNVIREGWKNVVTIIGNLFLHSLLPIGLLTADDFVQRSITNASRRETGLFSTLSHFLSLSSSSSNEEVEEYEPTAEELDAERFTVECITSCRIEELFADSRFMEEDALRFLMATLFQAFTGTSHSRAVVGHTVIPPRTSSDPNPREGVKYSAAAVFYMELVIRIALQNRDRMEVVWPLAMEYVGTVLGGAFGETGGAVGEGGGGVDEVDYSDNMVSKVFESLDLLRTLPPEAFNIVAEQVMAGLLSLLKLDQTIITQHSQWTTVIHLLSATSIHPEAMKSGFEIACILVHENSNDSLVTVENFGDFGGEGGGRESGREERSGSRNGESESDEEGGVGGKMGGNGVEIAVKSMEKLFKLQFKIPRLIQQSGIGRREFWLPILSGLGQQCYHPSREVRQHALTLLQRALLSSELESGTFGVPGFEITSSTMETWVEVYRLDPSGMDETRMRASALLCKIFLQYLQRMMRYKDLPRLWVHILNYMKRYMQASRQEFLNEGILESLKNMLLVMSTQGVFSPPESNVELKSLHNLWEVTWVHLEDFLPGLKDELFPRQLKTESGGGGDESQDVKVEGGLQPMGEGEKEVVV